MVRMGLGNAFLLVLLIYPGIFGDSYRLPKTITPFSYDIGLNFPPAVFEGTTTEFTGLTTIKFQTTVETDVINIYSPPMNNIRLIRDDIPFDAILLLQLTTNSTTNIRTLTFFSNLVPNRNYTLTVDYVAYVDSRDGMGVFRNSYSDETGINQLIVSQFQPTHARKAFPCFDEPQYKTTFTLSLSFPEGFNAFSNVPEKSSNIEGTNKTVQFVETPRMSTHHVAFVISKLSCTANETILSSISHTVCSRPETQDDRSLAIQNTALLLTSLQQSTGSTYQDQGFQSLVQVAVPDLYVRAMANWGLPTYRESVLIWNTLSSSNYDRQQVLSTIAENLAEFWFGNLVTCTWWDNLFLSKGFARYFGYFTIAKLPEFESSQNWQMARQFVVNQQQAALIEDGYISSKPLSTPVETQSEIEEQYGIISSSKGSSILRMIENMMGPANFLNGIRSYLDSRKFDNALPSHLWTSLQSHIEANTLPSATNLVQVLGNWIESAGYPVVTAISEGNNIRITQQRFLYNENATDLTQWYVPISYTVTSDSSPFISVTPRAWLLPNQNLVLENILQTNNWIILNNQASAYFRVNYDDLLWERIRQLLTSTHQVIHVLNRAQIVDDAFNLARAGVIGYDRAFGLINYLYRETDYLPWYSAIKGFDYLIDVYGETSDVGLKVIELQYYLLQNVYNDVSFSALNGTDQIHTLRLDLILQRLCRLGLQQCQSEVKQLFALDRNGTRVDKNLKSVVYCNAIRYSDNVRDDWDYLWNRLYSTSLAGERQEIIAALGCTNQPFYLEFYLRQTWNSSAHLRIKDFSSVFRSVYTSSSVGLDTALTFFVSNHEAIATNFADAPSVLKEIAARIFSQDQLTQLQTLQSSSNLSESLQEVLPEIIQNARRNLDWSIGRRNEIMQYFNNNPISSPTYPTPVPASTPSTPVSATTPSTTVPTTTPSTTPSTSSTAAGTTSTSDTQTTTPSTEGESQPGAGVRTRFSLVTLTILICSRFL